jgi:hypothetical protein
MGFKEDKDGINGSADSVRKFISKYYDVYHATMEISRLGLPSKGNVFLVVSKLPIDTVPSGSAKSGRPGFSAIDISGTGKEAYGATFATIMDAMDESIFKVKPHLQRVGYVMVNYITQFGMFVAQVNPVPEAHAATIQPAEQPDSCPSD